MKAFLFAFGVLGLAAVFGMFEPASAAAKPVTSDDVQLMSEEMSQQSEQASAYQWNLNRYGRTCAPSPRVTYRR